jgi:DNA-3-methyladenine glycosylase II
MPMIQPLDEPRLRSALDRLAAADPDIAAALPRIGYPAPRTREPGFATLLRIVVAQQISTKAAAAIWARLEAATAPVLSATSLLALSDADFRAVGFSLRKVDYARDLARAVAEGRLDLDGLATCAEEDLVARIAALRGFGRWSAEIYGLFALGRADIFPADDLALQVAAMRLKRLPTRPDGKALRGLAEPWRPWRGAAAVFLWHYYGAATLDDATRAA